MNKEVIYIDVEDDITAIIGKVKASKEKVVALVPPKRIGVLQSAVNLRLLARAAKQAGKQFALVTNNHALIALAAAASIPVAKNLQSTPEIADIPALKVDDGDDDIIEGASLPVGDHAGQQTSDEQKKEAKSAAMAAALAEAPKAGRATPKPKAKGTSKVPNFDKFRKKMVLIIIGSVLLLAFLIWAIFFAARATVEIKAKTTDSSVNAAVTLSATATTSFEKNTIKAVSKTKSEDKKVEFAATGKKDAGKKATGTVNFTNRSQSAKTLSAGTKLTNNGLTFELNSGVTVPAATLSFSCQPNNLCPGEASGGVSAAENGSKYNAASGSLGGTPSGVSASFADATSGGVTKTVKVVTAADVQKAKKSLVDEDTDSIKDGLKAELGDNMVVLDESFRVDYEDATSSPAIGEEADEATLNTKVNYVLYGVERSELGEFLDGYLEDSLKGSDDQRVYKNGADEASFQEVSGTKSGARGTVIATAQVGPRINEDEVKQQVKGKRYGEIQESLEAIQGIEDVDVKFFPFWVNAVPDDENKITIEFNIDAK